MPSRRTRLFRRNQRDDYRIIVTGAPRQDIDVDVLAQVIVKLAVKLAVENPSSLSQGKKRTRK